MKNDYGVRNAEQVRQVLEESGKVLAVFQGHSHKNDLNDIGGIHYCTLVAMVEGLGVENSGYSPLDVLEDGTLRLTRFRQHSSGAQCRRLHENYAKNWPDTFSRITSGS